MLQVVKNDILAVNSITIFVPVPVCFSISNFLELKTPNQIAYLVHNLQQKIRIRRHNHASGELFRIILKLAMRLNIAVWEIIFHFRINKTYV